MYNDIKNNTEFNRQSTIIERRDLCFKIVLWFKTTSDRLKSSDYRAEGYL